MVEFARLYPHLHSYKLWPGGCRDEDAGFETLFGGAAVSS